MPVSPHPLYPCGIRLTHSRNPPPPQFVPPEVVLAVYGMRAGLVLSAGFAIHEMTVSASVLDPFIRLMIFAGMWVTIKALPAKHLWARYASVLLTVLFYTFLALDADGLTNNDFWHMLAKAPIDIFVISRLFKPIVTHWLNER